MARLPMLQYNLEAAFTPFASHEIQLRGPSEVSQSSSIARLLQSLAHGILHRRFEETVEFDGMRPTRGFGWGAYSEAALGYHTEVEKQAERENYDCDGGCERG